MRRPLTARISAISLTLVLLGAQLASGYVLFRCSMTQKVSSRSCCCPHGAEPRVERDRADAVVRRAPCCQASRVEVVRPASEATTADLTFHVAPPAVIAVMELPPIASIETAPVLEAAPVRGPPLRVLKQSFLI